MTHEPEKSQAMMRSSLTIAQMESTQLLQPSWFGELLCDILFKKSGKFSLAVMADTLGEIPSHIHANRKLQDF